MALLVKQRPEDILMRAELHRKLGEFTAAIELLTAWDSEDEEARAIQEAARHAVSAPTVINYAWKVISKAI